MKIDPVSDISKIARGALRREEIYRHALRDLQCALHPDRDPYLWGILERAFKDAREVPGTADDAS